MSLEAPLGGERHLLRRGIPTDGVPDTWFVDAKRVVTIALNPDDELRNLQVALCYSLSSTRLAERISWSAPDGHPRARTNANWFTLAQWAVITVGRNLRTRDLPHRADDLPAAVRRLLTPSVLNLRSADDRRVAAALSYGQVMVFCSVYRALFRSHFADGCPMQVPKRSEGTRPSEPSGSVGPPSEVGPAADVVRGDPADAEPDVDAYLKRTAAADEARLEAARLRDFTERQTVVALARQIGADTAAIDPDLDKHSSDEFYRLVLDALAAESGYADELDRAFELYADAARWVEPIPGAPSSGDPRSPADLIFEANLRIAAIEQVFLDGAVTAVVDHVPSHLVAQGEGRTAVFAERMLRVPRFIAQVNASRRLSAFTEAAKEVWARLMTDQVLVLALPTETIRLGRSIPAKDWRKPFYAPDLQTLSPEAQHLFDQFDRSMGDGRGAGAGDWRRFDDRMNFVANLLRSRQQDSTLFWQPYTDEDVARIWDGQYPTRLADPFEQAVRTPPTAYAGDDFDEQGLKVLTCDPRIEARLQNRDPQEPRRDR